MHRSSVIVLIALGAFCLSLPLLSEAKQGQVQFDFRKKGGAKAALGPQALERVRRKSGQVHKTVEELAKTLDIDADLGVDVDNDMLIYACSGMEVEAPNDSQPLGHHHHHHHRHLMGGGEIASGWMPHNQDASITKDQAFSLHSRPNATRKIFLDFDGHTTTGTAWNSWKGIDPIVSPAYDEDGDPTTFSDGELADILAIWRAVSEDYAAFDVDVTTEDPGAAYLATNGVRAVIGGSSYDWLGYGAGGIAYVGVFGQYNNYYQPAFIFPAQLGNGYAKYVWEAISHEVGHTVGLSHDGTTTGTAYYAGQGDWAPIMGVGYYSPVTQFSKGEYANSNNLEDDFAIMSGYLGAATAIPEEHGSDSSTATPLTAVLNADGVTATATGSGIIKYPGDFDVFSFAAATAGTATLQVLGMPAWGSAARSNLNMQLTVTDATNTALASTTGVGIGAFTITLPAAGTYYVSVTGAGSGDPTTTGYSSYGSRGVYEVVATYPGAQPRPSPSPQPSPSPSPRPPSPSPAPVASPSPSPAPSVMTISSIVGSRQTSGNKVTCTFSVTIVNKSTNAKLGGASVSGTWNTVKATAGWPYTATTATTGSSSTSLGVATITSSKTLPTSTGNGCYFSVTSVTLAGYTLDPAAVTRSPTLSW